jgi:hypothetical protein
MVHDVVMASSDSIREEDITGLKFSDKLKPLLERLHGVGCRRDAAHNRELHYDQYCMLALLFLFNPIVTSLRGLQQASELKKVQKKLGCPRTSLGSLSESVTVFEPERLKEIITEPSGQLELLGRDPRIVITSWRNLRRDEASGRFRAPSPCSDHPSSHRRRMPRRRVGLSLPQRRLRRKPPRRRLSWRCPFP